jgi:hypothetical protein
LISNHSTAEFRESLEQEEKRSKGLWSQLEVRTRELEEAQNEVQLRMTEIQISEELAHEMRTKLDAAQKALLELQEEYNAEKAEGRSKVVRVSNAERVEEEVRGHLRQAVLQRDDLEQEAFAAARNVALLMSKVEGVECTITAVRERVATFCETHERRITASNSRYARLHDESTTAAAAAAQFEAEKRRLAAEISQQSQRSHALELSLQQVLEDAARARDMLQDRASHDQLAFKASLEKELLAASQLIDKLCCAIDPSMARDTTRATPPLLLTRRWPSEAAGKTAKSGGAEENGRDDEEMGKDSSLAEALGMGVSEAWSERGLAASARALEINCELAALRDTKDALLHRLEAKNIESQGLKEDLEVVCLCASETPCLCHVPHMAAIYGTWHKHGVSMGRRRRLTTDEEQIVQTGGAERPQRCRGAGNGTRTAL